MKLPARFLPQHKIKGGERMRCQTVIALCGGGGECQSSTHAMKGRTNFGTFLPKVYGQLLSIFAIGKTNSSCYFPSRVQIHIG